MNIWLVRHAVAHERSARRWPDDSQRPLTPAGRRKFRQAARGLATLLPRSTPILTSPFVRARQTADLLSAASGGRVVECAELAHGGAVAAVIRLLNRRAGTRAVLVGHEPEFGRLLAAMVGARGMRSTNFEFRKGGAACLEFSGRIAAGSGTLLCFLPPKVLRALR
ncbi:MAG TPA: histidine phosphatase family protein [Steroidobacteraceae bacterium]|nr:histidine phosphatase family protein [Steroidobacteraceae bacterium]